MGDWIDFTNRVHIDMNTVSECVLHSLSYKDLTAELIAEIKVFQLKHLSRLTISLK